MIVNGKISINVENKTVRIKLENGSYCLDLFTHGAKRFLDDEIEMLQKKVQMSPDGWLMVEGD